ncbi:MAG: sulfurtransferase [Anaerolineaceae bacterium]|jgi:thiosulfate/3-mercaptopyruvate sulfurtransferase
MNNYANPKALVTTQWVFEHLDDPKVRIVEVIWGSQTAYGWDAYAAGHIPGAVAWDYETDYGEVQGDVIDRQSFEEQLSRSGITPDMTVVLYSSVNNLLATFEFWLMEYHRHEDVRLLDGDRDKWLAENRPLESTIPTYPPTLYKSKEPDESLRASRGEVQQAIRKEGVLLVDARSAEMYRGEFHPTTQHGGHIPGAINLAAKPELDADGSFRAWRVPTVLKDGTFKTPKELQAIFEDLGITSDREIITYCLRGGLSTHAWFVLTQLLGYPRVREYDRSWAEWGNQADLPIER